MQLATIKHVSSENANYGDAESYLTFEHDEFSGKALRDKNGNLIPREEYRMDTLLCGEDDFAIACMRANLRYEKNNLRGDVKSHGGRIAFQAVMPDCVVQNGDHLIVDALQVVIGIRLLALIPEGQQLILPGDDILGVNLADDPLPEGWDQLLLNHVFLGLPSACLQARTNILFI